MSWESLIIEFLKASVVRSSILVGISAVALWLFKVRHPATRHTAWTAVLAGMLLIPFLSVAAPSPAPTLLQGKQTAETQRDNAATAVIAGRLLLADGSPASNIKVEAWREDAPPTGAVSLFTIVGSTRTDANGRYRIEIPTGGIYGVVAEMIPLTFYPGVTAFKSARLVPVTVGQTVNSVDFAPDPTSGVRVRGRIVPPPGAAAGAVHVGLGDPYFPVPAPPIPAPVLLPPVPAPPVSSLGIGPDEIQGLPLFGNDPLALITTLPGYRATPFEGPWFRAYHPAIGLRPVAADGTFEFPLVPQGSYAVRVFPNESALAGERIVVGDTEVAGVEVALAQVLVTGHVIVEGGNLSVFPYPPLGDTACCVSGPPSLPRTTVSIQAAGPKQIEAQMASGGVFRLVLVPGQYRISAALPFGYYLKSLSYGATDLLRAPLDASATLRAIIVARITTAPPDAARSSVTVRGHATGLEPNTLAGGPLVAVLYDEVSGRFGFSPVNAEGMFEIRGVPPGTYSAYVTVPGASVYKDAPTIVVGDGDVSRVELPVDPNVIYKKR